MVVSQPHYTGGWLEIPGHQLKHDPNNLLSIWKKISKYLYEKILKQTIASASQTYQLFIITEMGQL